MKKDRDRSNSEFYPYGGISDEDVEFILRMNETHHVYFGVNLRPLNRKKKQNDIKNIICLWVDLDGKDFQDGKAQAKQAIDNFEFRPNIIVDSGNGFHAYWIFKEPIIGVDKGKRAEIKQVLSGLVKYLNADSQALNLDRIMRLPGTNNIKNDKPVECKIICINQDRLYDLSDFKQFQDSLYKESELDIEKMSEFGEKELIVRSDTAENAEADIKKLEIKSKHKRRILTGALKTEGDSLGRRGQEEAGWVGESVIF